MTIRFPKLSGRSYGYRSTAQTGAPEPTTTVARPLPTRGAQFDTTSVPASRAIVGGIEGPNADDRSYLGRTEDALNLGPIPNRIDRRAQALNHGYIGPNGGSMLGMAGWPYDGNALRIPHQIIPRTPITVTAFQRTIDLSVTIPAVAVGGPVE